MLTILVDYITDYLPPKLGAAENGIMRVMVDTKILTTILMLGVTIRIEKLFISKVISVILTNPV